MTGETKVPDADALLRTIHGVFVESCLYCGEYGTNGQPMGCGFEELVTVMGWHGKPELARTRCLLRSWIDAYVTDCDPSESEMGVADERTVRHGLWD